MIGIRVIRVPTPSPPPSHSGGNVVSDSEKAEALTDTVETQFQPVADTSVPAVNEMVDVALRSYFQTPASEPKLTNPDEVHEANRGLKVGKTWPKQYTERSLEAHSPASGIPPGPDLHRTSPHPLLPLVVGTRSVYLYP